MAAVDVLGPIQAATNYSKDPLQTRIGFYTQLSTSTLTIDTAFKWSGTSSLKQVLSVAVAVDTGLVRLPIWSGASPNDAVPVVAGNVIAAAWNAYTPNAGKSLKLGFRFWTAAGVEITAGGPWRSTAQAVTNVAGQWSLIRIDEVTVPATAAFATLQTYAGSAFSISDTIYMSGMDIRKNQPFDTIVAGSFGSGYSWTGTADQSTSIRAAANPLGVSGFGGVHTVSTEVFRSDALGSLYDDLTDYVIDGEISNDIDREIKGACRLLVTDPTAFLDYSWVKIYQTVFEEVTGQSTRYPVGLFRISVGATSWTDGISDLSGLDPCVQLSDTIVTNTYNIAAGTKYTDAIRALLIAAGFVDRYSIPDSALTVPTDGLTFPSHSSYLSIINKLLAAIGYYSLFAYPNGYLASIPYRSRLNIEPTHVFTIGQNSELIETFEEVPSSDNLSNYVVVTKTQSDQTVSQAIAENKNPAHRYSTVALGALAGLAKVYRMKEITVGDDVATSALQSIANEELERSAMLRYVRFQMLPHPEHDPHEVVELDFDGTNMGHLSGRYYFESSSFGLVGSAGTMSGNARRIEDVNG